MNPSKVTAEDVARLAGVSKWTVIRAFREGASISSDSKARVQSVAGRLGYQPNLLARSLATSRTDQIAVLVDDFRNPHKLPILEALSLAIQARGMVMTLININEHFDQVDAMIHARQRQVDGIILFANSSQDDILEDAKAGRTHTPMVILGRESAVALVPSVTTDVAASISEICGHLAARGYRKPGFMTGPPAHASVVSRSECFRSFWIGRGVSGVPIIAAGAYDYDRATGAMRNYLAETKGENRIDVLLCENDILAFGAMDAARYGFGLRVPEDIAIAGYDNIPLAASAAYDLTSYEQPPEALAITAMDILLGIAQPTNTSLTGKLCVRRSA